MPYPAGTPNPHYNPEQKHQAVYLAELYNSVPKAATELDIAHNSIYKWVRQDILSKEDKEEIAFLRKRERSEKRSEAVDMWADVRHKSLKKVVDALDKDVALEDLPTGKLVQLTTMGGIATDKDLALSGETPADRKIQVNIMLPGTQDPGNRESPVELRPGERHIEIGRIEPE